MALSSRAARQAGGKILGIIFGQSALAKFSYCLCPRLVGNLFFRVLQNFLVAPMLAAHKKPFVGFNASQIPCSISAPRSGLWRTGGSGLSLLTRNRRYDDQ